MKKFEGYNFIVLKITVPLVSRLRIVLLSNAAWATPRLCPLQVSLKFSDEHPRPFNIGFPPWRLKNRPKRCAVLKLLSGNKYDFMDTQTPLITFSSE